MRKRGLVAAAAASVAVAAAIARGTMRRFAIVESSMEPALEPGDWVLARRFRPPPRRGDIVVFPDPLVPGRNLVKRIVGLPDETVELRDGRVLVNGEPLDDPWGNGPARPDDRLHLPDDAVFVLGDRRPVSAGDSRQLGPIPVSALEWRVVSRYWPARRIGPV